MNMRRMTNPSGTGATGAADWRWPLWGIGAGVLGAIGHLFTIQVPSAEEVLSGPGVIDALDRTNYHLGIVTGLAGVFCLLILAAAWRRWASAVAPENLAAGAVSLAMTASAGAMLLAYGFKGALAVYLPGGTDEGVYANESLLTFFMFDDFSAFISWWGVAMAAGAMAWLALKDRLLPMWIGVVAAVFAIVPVGFVVAIGLPGFPGVIDPFGLIILSTGLAISLRRTSTRPATAADRATAIA